MLQRLAQFRVALLQFFEQPHVLDGDDRLVGEGFEQCDLLVGKRMNLVRRMLITPMAIPSRSSGVARKSGFPSLLQLCRCPEIL